MIIPLHEKDIVLDPRARGPWCKLPYPGHSRGCPNYGKKKTCPPQSKPFIYLVRPPFFLVARPFNLWAQATRMKKLHPSWSDRQCRNLLYWQKSIIKKLRDEANVFIKSKGDDFILLEVPEANGVNVFKTCENVNILLERDPKKIVWKAMIIGKKI